MPAFEYSCSVVVDVLQQSQVVQISECMFSTELEFKFLVLSCRIRDITKVKASELPDGSQHDLHLGVSIAD